MDSYRLDLERRFLPCLVSRGVTDAREISEADIATFLGAERVRGVSVWSLRKSYDIVKRFLEWCVTQGEIQHNPAYLLKPPKMPVSTRVGYTREEVTRLLEYARTSWSWLGQRDYAIVLFLLGTGVRAGGILGLTVDDVTSSDYLQNRRLRVLEKGSKERWVPVGRKAAHAIAEYLAVRPKVPDRALWITQRKGPLRYEALIAMLNKLGSCAGVEDTMTHRFRHTFSAEHYKANRDIKALQSALGHSSVVTTEGYLLSLGLDFAMQAKAPNPDEWLA